MKYVIQNIRSGKFVSWAGYSDSYTRDFLKVRRYRTYEDAERDLCKESERIIKMD